MCFQKSSSRKKFKRLIKFLNTNRIWICGGNCIVAPECFYCQLIYQLNYSFIKNRTAAIETFRNSVFCNAFTHFEELYERHAGKKRWANYNESFKTITAHFTINLFEYNTKIILSLNK